MLKNTFKVLMLLLIAVSFTIPVFAGGGRQAATTYARGPDGIPEYLNTGFTQPIIKPGYDITLRFLAPMHFQFGGRTEDLWFWEHVRQTMNINVEVEQVINTAMAERRSLLFATGDLPDIMFELGLQPVDIMNYGVRDGQLLNIVPYLTPLLAPGLLNSFEMTPAARALMTAPNGGIYAWPSIGAAGGTGGLPDFFMNMAWARSLGFERPETLDDFYNILIAFRDRDPSGTGRILPLGGSAVQGGGGIAPWLLSAYGFLIRFSTPRPPSDYIFTDPAVRNGRVEIPAGSPVFRDFLEFMNLLWRERLLNPNYFTDEPIANRAAIAERRVGAMHESPSTTLLDPADFQMYEALSPLTSRVNPTRQVGRTAAPINIRTVASADTRHPEAVVRFMDWFYDPTGHNQAMAWNGPPPGPLTYGMFQGFVYTPDWTEYYQDVEDGLFPGAWELILGRIAPFTGTHGDQSDRFNVMREMSGLPRIGERGFRDFQNLNFPNNYYENQMRTHLRPYGVDSFPRMVWFTTQESQRLADIKTVIDNFVEQEVARFITGANPLNDATFNAYINQLNALGLREYESIYQRAWEQYLAAQR